MFEIIAFYFFSVFTLLFFLISVISKNILYSMSALVGGMVFVSGFFFLLGAEFLGVVQIIVYVGAVIVLYAFSMMFFDAQKEVKEIKRDQKIIYTMSFISVVLILIMILLPNLPNIMNNQVESEFGNIESIGFIIFTRYLLLFEMIAIMLLVSMICAIVLLHKNMQKTLEQLRNEYEKDMS